MGHNLFQGRMAYVGKPPWHELGVKVPESIKARDMCIAAGLDWLVRKAPAPGARLIDPKNKLFDRYLISRDPVKGEQSSVALGLVTGQYELLQNTEAFAFFEPFIESGFAIFHTAGALGNGERVWVLAKLKGQMFVAGDDKVERYLLLSNSHDGSGAVSIRFTPIRVVCQNTLNIAMKRNTGVISIRHTRNLAQHLAKAQAQELTRMIVKVFDAAAALFDKMAERTLSFKQVEDLLEVVFPRTNKKKEPERWRRVKEILEDDRLTPPKTKETLWALYNAIVRDEDYRESREASAEARLNRYHRQALRTPATPSWLIRWAPSPASRRRWP
jgi:phage/plasmid-like protein (TIGR03299 family)